MSELLQRLESARFTGYLELHFDRGKIVSAELRHWLANSEFEKPLPTIEEDAGVERQEDRGGVRDFRPVRWKDQRRTTANR
ncbi:MAG: hypothetical protein QUT30_01440 [Acidobacteriota bacterium]|nr:hypothetical protein [Acidobacteriota bacterium]